MSGCATCGGFGDRHDPIAHGAEPECHDGTAHTDGPGHFWLTCSCGWVLDPAPNNWDRWIEMLNEHRAEAAS